MAERTCLGTGAVGAGAAVVESTWVATVGELCDLTEDEFLATRGFGETSHRETRARLVELGLRFCDPSEPPRLERRPFGPPCGPELDDKLSREELLELPGGDAGVVAELSRRLAEGGLRLRIRVAGERGGGEI